jgi:hypothetical protein
MSVRTTMTTLEKVRSRIRWLLPGVRCTTRAICEVVPVVRVFDDAPFCGLLQSRLALLGH